MKKLKGNEMVGALSTYCYVKSGGMFAVSFFMIFEYGYYWAGVFFLLIGLISGMFGIVFFVRHRETVVLEEKRKRRYVDS